MEAVIGLFPTRFQATGHGIHWNVIAEPVTWKSPGVSLPGSLRRRVEGLGRPGKKAPSQSRAQGPENRLHRPKEQTRPSLLKAR